MVFVHGIFAVVLLLLLSKCLFQRDWHGNGEASDLDHEVGATAEIKVGELIEGALDLEETGDLVVKGMYTCPTCYKARKWEKVS